jgi:hypothetical protein
MCHSLVGGAYGSRQTPTQSAPRRKAVEAAGLGSPHPPSSLQHEMMGRRPSPVVVPEPVPSLGVVETSIHVVAMSPRGGRAPPGLHRRASVSSPSAEEGSSSPQSPSECGRRPVQNVAFVLGTFFSWSVLGVTLFWLVRCDKQYTCVFNNTCGPGQIVAK